MSEFHGWTKGTLGLHVGRLPGKKRPVLYASESNEFCASVTPLASFASEAAAKAAMAILDEMFGLKAEKP